MKRPLYSDFYSDAKLKGSSIFFIISSLNTITHLVNHLWERKHYNKVPSRLEILKTSRIQRIFSAFSLPFFPSSFYYTTSGNSSLQNKSLWTIWLSKCSLLNSLLRSLLQPVWRSHSASSLFHTKILSYLFVFSWGIKYGQKNKGPKLNGWTNSEENKKASRSLENTISEKAEREFLSKRGPVLWAGLEPGDQGGKEGKNHSVGSDRSSNEHNPILLKVFRIFLKKVFRILFRVRKLRYLYSW